MAQIKPLPLELQKIAETELGEYPQQIPNYLLALKTWIKQQPHLKARLDDQFLIHFLRGCKYNLERAKNKIDLFFTLKTKFSKLFNVTNVNEKRFREMANFGLGVPLPRPLNDNGPRIYIFNAYGDVAKGLCDIEDMYCVMNAQQEIFLMDDPYVCVNGIIYIWDLENITLDFAAKYTLSLLKKLLQFYENALPFRIRGVHVINMPAFFDNVISNMVTLLSNEIRQKTTIDGRNLDNLKKKIPVKYLPKYLGGENGTWQEQRVEFNKKWLEYADYFKENAIYGTNEELRTGKPIDFDYLFD